MSVKDNGNLKIAIASHGLGLVTRGTEMWAKNLSYALKEKGVDIHLYKGWGKAESEIESVLPCIKRDSKFADRLVRLLPSCRWRLGFGTTHSVEGTTFALNLIKEIVLERFDAIHTADENVATVLLFAKKLGVLKSKIILARGTEETLDFIRQFEVVQQRAPYYIEQVRVNGISVDKWFAIPNFVDTNKFNPVIQTELKERLNIPDDGFVILSVAAIESTRKRIDWLINEIVDLTKKREEKIYLLIVGAETKETSEIIRLGKNLLGERIRFLINEPYNNMPKIYAAANVFVMCSLQEVFGIAFIEAMACGIPAIGHCYPVTQWIIGEGGDYINMCQDGSLSNILQRYLDYNYRSGKSYKARQEVLRRFSKDIIVEQVINMYKSIMEKNNGRKKYHL